jgi:hypothetical protein
MNSKNIQVVADLLEERSILYSLYKGIDGKWCAKAYLTGETVTITSVKHAREVVARRQKAWAR